jgi:hypothetical protein
MKKRILKLLTLYRIGRAIRHCQQVRHRSTDPETSSKLAFAESYLLHAEALIRARRDNW